MTSPNPTYIDFSDEIEREGQKLPIRVSATCSWSLGYAPNWESGYVVHNIEARTRPFLATSPRVELTSGERERLRKKFIELYIT